MKLAFSPRSFGGFLGQHLSIFTLIFSFVVISAHAGAEPRNKMDCEKVMAVLSPVIGITLGLGIGVLATRKGLSIGNEAEEDPQAELDEGWEDFLERHKGEKEKSEPYVLKHLRREPSVKKTLSTPVLGNRGWMNPETGELKMTAVKGEPKELENLVEALKSLGLTSERPLIFGNPSTCGGCRILDMKLADKGVAEKVGHYNLEYEETNPTLEKIFPFFSYMPAVFFMNDRGEVGLEIGADAADYINP